MANLSSPREQGPLIQTPVTKPTFKPPSPKEADLQSYRAVAGFFATQGSRMNTELLASAALKSNF